MKTHAFIYLSVFFIFFVQPVHAQSAKSYFKTGEDFVDNGNYQDAIEQFTKAIDIDPDYDKAYLERARTYEMIGMIKEAALDYDRASVFMPKKEDVFYDAGRLYFNLGEYVNAIEKLDKAILLKSNFLEAIVLKTKSLIKLESFSAARILCDEALSLKQNAENYYMHGIIMENTGQYVKAESDYIKAFSKEKNFIDAYIALASLQLKMNKTDEALEVCNEALTIDPDNTEANYIRSQINVKNLNYPAAINDISKILINSPDNEEMYFTRGIYYQEFTQHQNAINDFSKVLLVNPRNSEAYYRRAKSYEEIANYQAAIKDYEKLTELSRSDEQAKRLLAESKKRLFELNRESNKPVIKLVDPEPKEELVIEFPRNKKEVTIRGLIEDESGINYVKINGRSIPFVETDNRMEFLTTFDISGTEMVTVTVSDVYDNLQVNNYSIHWTEINPPEINIIAPYASDNGEIYLDTEGQNIYIEGKVEDESTIRNILVDGVTASYRVDEYNPVFNATINITNKNKFTVRAIDKYGNESNTEFRFNREGIVTDNNPMGKTWVVFVENSDYEYFPSLDGPVKDVSLMRSALVNYQIHNFIHKTNMSKKDMEKFFSIELRDLVRSNRVNAILIWYAGHGKFIHETGYWIPVDARRDDEFSYFNINALKASLQSYTKYVDHTLIVTDACESGPTFYEAMRGMKERDCHDWEATRFKSSQVFSSAGYELAVDNSQFTRTFANALANNPDACIPIETIVTKVTKAVVENNQQKPRFGKINGLEDEDGTFFFVAKE